MSGPGFRHEEWLVHVLSRFAVRRDMSRGVAGAVIEAAEEQLGIDTLRSWLPVARRPSDDDALRAELACALVEGCLKLVRHTRAHEPMRSPEIQELVDLIETTDEERPRPPWIEVCCLGPKGETYAFASCRVRMPDGTERYAKLDHRSRFRVESVPGHGTCEFELSRDARPDGGRLSPPKPTAVVYEFGTAATVETSRIHVLQLSAPSTWIEIQVVDTRGRPVPHFQGSLRSADGEHSIELDPAAVFRADALPDTTDVSVTLGASAT